mgnify:CR=1 FL=1
MPHPEGAGSNQERAIQPESFDGRAAGRCSAQDTRRGGAPSEVVVPSLSSRIEQRGETPCPRVSGMRQRLLVTVALRAAKAEIGGIVYPAACLGTM